MAVFTRLVLYGMQVVVFALFGQQFLMSALFYQLALVQHDVAALFGDVQPEGQRQLPRPHQPHYQALRFKAPQQRAGEDIGLHVDHHDVLAAIGPRPVMLVSGTEDKYSRGADEVVGKVAGPAGMPLVAVLIGV